MSDCWAVFRFPIGDRAGLDKATNLYIIEGRGSLPEVGSAFIDHD